ncbi:MAG: 4Fe-4S binding protein [Solobacterium sp.]|nr:4Fe-4S binding protein [Solobacterium sp.]MBR4457016.1 4Fe-4S binding protein [Solobacterium sp.]
MVYYIEDSCLLCGNCADLCPTDAIDVNQIRAEL